MRQTFDRESNQISAQFSQPCLLSHRLQVCCGMVLKEYREANQARIEVRVQVGRQPVEAKQQRWPPFRAPDLVEIVCVSSLAFLFHSVGVVPMSFSYALEDLQSRKDAVCPCVQTLDFHTCTKSTATSPVEIETKGHLRLRACLEQRGP